MVHFLTSLVAVAGFAATGLAAPGLARGPATNLAPRAAGALVPDTGDTAGGPGFYGITFNPGSQYGILHVSSSDTVPGPRPSSAVGDVFTWPGIQPPFSTPSNVNYVFQAVYGWLVSAQKWDYSTYFCCNPDKAYESNLFLKGGAACTSVFDYTEGANNWAINYNCKSAATPNANPPLSGSDVFSFNGYPAASLAIFTIEVQTNAYWDMGPVTWTDIVIVSNSSSTAWCSGSPSSSTLKYTMSTPVVSSSGASSTCKIAKLTLNSPS